MKKLSDQDWQVIFERRTRRNQRIGKTLLILFELGFFVALVAFIVYRECHIWGWVE